MTQDQKELKEEQEDHETISRGRLPVNTRGQEELYFKKIVKNTRIRISMLRELLRIGASGEGVHVE